MYVYIYIGICMCIYIYTHIYIYIYIYREREGKRYMRGRGCARFDRGWIDVSIYCQEAIRNRTEPAEPNRTESFNSGTGRNRTRNRTEPNWTESRRVRKTQAEPRRTGKEMFRTEPNRTEANRLIFERNMEPKRIEPKRLLPDLAMRVGCG